jgi:hypothetical protein
MTAMTTDRAREMLGGRGNGHDVLNGRDLLAGHANRQGTVLVTRPRRFWARLSGGGQDREPRTGRKPGSGLITTALVLLVFLGIGLLAVSVAAQYRYVLVQRHQVTASAIEALALDVGLCILSCLALALSRRGLASAVERVLILAVAGASAGMNFAAANPSSWRSVLAYCMPPAFLAVIVDRVVSVIRRHYLEMPDVSPWRLAGRAVIAAARFSGLAVLYGLRLVLDPPGTCTGVRRAILAATPLPRAPERPQIEAPEDPIAYCSALVDAGPVRLPCRKAMPCTVHPQDSPEWVATHCLVVSGENAFCAKPLPCPVHDPAPRRDRRPRGQGGGTKTARFLELVQTRHGELATIPLSQVSKIATAIAPDADLHPASARTALLAAVRAALPAGEGDAR